MAFGPSLKLGMVMLAVSDASRAASFYVDKLGAKLAGRFGEFAFVDIGGTTIGLSEDLIRARRAPASGSEGVEIVWRVPSVRAAVAALRERGVTFAREPSAVDGTNVAAHFEDPDGHLLSLFGPP